MSWPRSLDTFLVARLASVHHSTAFMNQNPEVPVRVTTDHNLAQEWELVLLAHGLSPSLRPIDGGIALSVPESEADRARAALLAYENENAAKLVEQSEPADFRRAVTGGVVSGIFILVMFFVTTVWLPTVSWFERGGADAGRILHGELWRVVTALTLHADVAHAVSNAAAAAIFIGMASNLTGLGFGTALILIAGAGGNLANAILHGSPHVSIGASTAVFGAVGLVSSLTMVEHRRELSRKRRAWLPIAAALALLGMLGSGGARVDIWAHLCGLLIGVVLGIGAGYVTPRAPGPRIQWFFGSAAVGLLIYSWMLALR
jgi:membrane associated rhomboid family serine protease